MKPVVIGVGGPVGSGKTLLIERVTRAMNDKYSCAVITNDIYTKEDAKFMVKNSVLSEDRVIGVETGGCPHTAIREDASMNFEALDELKNRFDDLEKIPRKAGQGMIKSDLFIINKIDLAPYVGADLEVMRKDTLAFRNENSFIFTNLKTDEGINEVINWIKKNCLLEGIS